MAHELDDFLPPEEANGEHMLTVDLVWQPFAQAMPDTLDVVFYIDKREIYRETVCFDTLKNLHLIVPFRCIEIEESSVSVEARNLHEPENFDDLLDQFKGSK